MDGDGFWVVTKYDDVVARVARLADVLVGEVAVASRAAGS